MPVTVTASCDVLRTLAGHYAVAIGGRTRWRRREWRDGCATEAKTDERETVPRAVRLRPAVRRSIRDPDQVVHCRQPSHRPSSSTPPIRALWHLVHSGSGSYSQCPPEPAQLRGVPVAVDVHPPVRVAVLANRVLADLEPLISCLPPVSRRSGVVSCPLGAAGRRGDDSSPGQGDQRMSWRVMPVRSRVVQAVSAVTTTASTTRVCAVARQARSPSESPAW
jgi:hypothetical protein